MAVFCNPGKYILYCWLKLQCWSARPFGFPLVFGYHVHQGIFNWKTLFNTPYNKNFNTLISDRHGAVVRELGSKSGGRAFDSRSLSLLFPFFQMPKIQRKRLWKVRSSMVSKGHWNQLFFTHGQNTKFPRPKCVPWLVKSSKQGTKRYLNELYSVVFTDQFCS